MCYSTLAANKQDASILYDKLLEMQRDAVLVHCLGCGDCALKVRLDQPPQTASITQGISQIFHAVGAMATIADIPHHHIGAHGRQIYAVSADEMHCVALFHVATTEEGTSYLEVDSEAATKFEIPAATVSSFSDGFTQAMMRSNALDRARSSVR